MVSKFCISKVGSAYVCRICKIGTCHYSAYCKWLYIFFCIFCILYYIFSISYCIFCILKWVCSYSAYCNVQIQHIYCHILHISLHILYISLDILHILFHILHISFHMLHILHIDSFLSCLVSAMLSSSLMVLEAGHDCRMTNPPPLRRASAGPLARGAARPPSIRPRAGRAQARGPGIPRPRF